MPSSANLGPLLDKVVGELVESGRYGSRSEVLREGVRLVQEREAALKKLRAEIQKGVDDVEAGRVRDIDEVEHEVLDRISRRVTAARKR